MRRNARLFAAGTAWLLLTASTIAQDAPATKTGATTRPAASQPKLHCPVCDRTVDRDVRGRFRGRRVYFCREECRKKFEADPYAYGEALQAQWRQDRPWRTQVRCPVTGKTAQRDIYLDRGEIDVYFADAAAREKYANDPQAYADALSRCYVFQTTCATCDNLIRPDVAKKVGRRTVYFCCPGCRAAFDTDPIGFLKSVEDEIRENQARRSRREEADRATP
ncbi:MAG: hypothetical protein D6744_14435 [Planctomycetota bacterium]|nr:MAG: hypothetical protein D6744_14435 [Planctomycetota bacterium]